ncbi:MAG: AI-2E family transporter [Frisingicoccus sp.]|uniref:AI-2E family transporter n=5 Tax=Frisingicoccus sp. TaxID=1918627 RepID=UPI00263376D8|nr:AI-2E family transporter [Frisingicoccus sp.]MDD6231951.1 AI-2E family transporter [Frisingicoccus sp.]MDY4834905.1 AI-2E family transporter [Frisingicoccus sp.]
MSNEQNHLSDEKNGWELFRKGLRQAAVYIFVIFVTVLFIFILFKWTAIKNAFGVLMRILAPVIFGLVIAYILMPVVNFIQRKLSELSFFKKWTEKKRGNMVRGISVAFTIVLAIGIVVILGYMVVPQLVISVSQIIYRFPSYTRQVAEWFEYMQADGQLSEDIQNLIKQGMELFQTWMKNDLYPRIMDGINVFTSSMMNIFGFFYNTVIGIIISIYVLMSTETFTGQSKKITYALFKPDMANSVIDVVRHSNQIFSGFIIGKLIDSAIIGVVCFIVLNLIHMPYAMLVSVIVGVTNIIPFFGPYIGAIPSVLLISLTDLKQGIIFLVFIIILQQIDGNILGPKILGNSTGLSPFWVIFAILLGGGLFGFPGMLLGVPVFAVIYYLVKTFIEYMLYKKKMPLETPSYTEAEGYDTETQQLIYINADETAKERRERYGSYKNVRIERDIKKNKNEEKSDKDDLLL